MRERLRELVSRLPRPDGEARRHRFVAGVLCSATLAGSVPVIAALRTDSISDVRGTPGTFWLSGELNGQVVLAATRGESASLAMPLETGGSELDVVDTGELVLVHHRTDGEITWVDAIGGVVGGTLPGWAPVDDRPVLLPGAGDAWLVDPQDGRVQLIEAASEPSAAPTPRPALDVAPFDQWVATNDGRLWLLDSPTGSLVTVDGDQVSVNTTFAEPGSDLSLSAVGPDPIVLDRTAGRLRWPRVADSYPLEGIENRGLLQEPSLNGSCAVIVTDGIAVCADSEGPVASMLFGDATADLLGAQLFANAGNLVLARPGDPQLVLGSWPASSSVTVERPAPSTRRLTNRWSPDGLLVDDPGSGFAVTADAGELFVLDKFSTRTVVLSSDGFAAGAGVGPSGGGDGTGTGAEPATANTDVLEGTNTGDNDPPTAAPDEVTTRVGRAKKIDVLANDSDPDNDPLVVVSAVPDEPGEGTVEVLEGSAVLFTPVLPAPLKTTFRYTIADPEGQSDVGLVTVNVVGENTNTDPVAADDTFEVTSGVSAELDVVANDADVEGDVLSISRVDDARHGTVSVTDSGTLRYQSAPGYTGVDEFRYDVLDGYGGTASASVRVTVVPSADENQPPVAVADRITLVAGNTTIVDVLDNDTDPDGDALRLVADGITIDASTRLTVTVLPDQQVSVTAPPGTEGLYRVQYQVTDDVLTARGQLTVVVQAQTADNRPPIAIDDTFVVASVARSLPLTANDTDPDGDPLTITEISGLDDATKGTVRRLSAGSVQFEPAAPVNVPETLSFTYTVSDPSGRTDEARVTVQLVPPTNSGPVARDDVVSIFPGETATVAVLGNDTHPDGLPFGIVGEPSYSAGSARVNPDNTISFDPPGQAEATYTLSYTIADSNGRTSSAKVVVSVIKRPTVNVAPVAVNDQFPATVNTFVLIPVLANDVDPEGQPLTLVSVGAATRGSATRSNVGDQVRYAAPASPGFDTFTYTVADPAGERSTGTVVVQVVPAANQAPIARDDVAALYTGESQVVDVLINDVDPDGTISDLNVAITVAPGAGLEASVASGNRIRLQAGSSAGTYTVTYSVTDAGSPPLSSSASIAVTVDPPPNTAPVAATDRRTTSPNSPITISVLDNDVDAEGGLITLVSVTQPAPGQGTTSVSGNSVVYDPGNFGGGDATFSYTVRDVGGLTAAGTVVVTVTQCSLTTPNLSNDSFAVARGSVTTYNVFDNDAVHDGAWTLGPATGGTVAKAGGRGNVLYTAPASAGTYSFTYSLDNKCGGPGVAVVTVTVNRPPKAVADTKTVDALSGPTTVDVLANDTDLDGKGEISLSSAAFVSSVPEGLVVNPSITNNGRVAFTAPDSAGTVVLSYVITDGAATSTGTITVTVRAPNNAPVTKDDKENVDAGSTVVVAPLANDTEPDGDPLILTDAFSLVSGPAIPFVPTSGIGGTIAFSPGPCAPDGPSVYSYFVTDGRNAGTLGFITIEVKAAPNQGPIATPDQAGPIDPDTPVSIDVMANDSDQCGDTYVIDKIRQVSGGTAEVSGGNVVVTATSGSTQVTFQYQLIDSSGATSTWADVTVTVNPPPPPPPDTTASPVSTP